MAFATRITRVANPKRGRGKFRLRTANRKKKNARRKLSPKQIKHFGTPAQKAALKRKRSRTRTTKRPAKRKRNGPKIKVIYRTRTKNRKTSHRRRKNPALVVTLGSINPKRRKSVAARKRRKKAVRNTRRRRTATSHRRRNTRRRRVAVAAPVRHRRRRRASSVRRRRNGRRHYSRRSRSRNPFGMSGQDLLKTSGGILVGVTVTKMIPKYIPASIVSSVGSGAVMAVVISAASAWIAGFLLKKVDAKFGEAAMWGGFAQTISVGLNAFLPSVGGTFSLGDLVNGNFVVPQNPIMAGMGGGMGRMSYAPGASAYPSAY